MSTIENLVLEIKSYGRFMNYTILCNIRSSEVKQALKKLKVRKNVGLDDISVIICIYLEN